jgi:hypothetical protein
MEELYLNGKKIDLEERSVSRSLQINNFREVQDRQANYSNNIKIPMTSNNIEVLNFLGIIGNTSITPYNTITAKYVIDGIEMITDGKAIVKKSLKDSRYYNLVIYDGNIALQDLLRGKMNELDFSSYNHNLDVGTYISSFSNTSGYIYASNTQSVVTINNQIPSFYIHTLVQMMFQEKGWTISDADGFLTSEDYLSRVVTMDSGFNPTITPSLTNIYNQYNTGTNGATYAVETTDEILIDTKSITSNGIHRIYFLGGITITFGSVILRIKKNGVSFKDITTVSPSITEDFNIYAENGDTLQVYAVATTEDVGVNWRYTFTKNYVTYIDIDESYAVVNFNHIIGDTTQIEFLKDVMQRFNLSFRKTRNQKNIEFIKAQSLLSGISGTEDWSDLFDNFLEESYAAPYAQINRFRYKYTDETLDFFDGIMNVQNVNLPIEKTLLTTIYKAPPTEISFIFDFAYWDENNTPKQDGQRLLKINRNNTFITFRLDSSQNYTNSSISNFATLTYQGTSYGSELFYYYPKYIEMLNKYEFLVCSFNLSLIDIYNLDFFKLKYVKQLGAYFYLNKVSNFQKGKPTKVELIKIPI